jgi:predicted Zn-dependent protease
LIEQVVNKLSANTGWFDIIEISGVSTPIQFRNNRLHSVTEYQNSGFGVRVSINGKTGFSYTNDASGLMEAADRAEATSKFGDIEDFELPTRISNRMIRGYMALTSPLRSTRRKMR